MRYKTWLLRLLCWDGLLPLLVASTPGFIAAVAPGVRQIEEFVGIALPIAACCVRAVIGLWNVERNGSSCLQLFIFFAAIFILVPLDALLIFSQQDSIAIQPQDWIVCGSLYLVYFLLMAFALFPFSENKQQ